MFLNGDLSVVGVASVHVDDVLDGVGAGSNTLIVGVGCRVGHGRERGLGACVEGPGRNTCGGLAVMDTSVPVRSPHGDPVAGSMPRTLAVIQGGRHPGRGERRHPGRRLRGRRVQILADSQPGQCLHDASERRQGIHVEGEPTEVALEQCPRFRISVPREGDAVDHGVT